MEKNDQQLLCEFITQGHEAAFSEITRRHGSMVMGTCMRILRNSSDAEDAFQATFLILARKANSIRQGTSLSGWLYRVAHRVACDLKTRLAQDRRREKEAATMKPHSSVPHPESDPSGGIIDKEIGRLPDRYRLAVVLHYLEERTYEDAARELGWSLASFKRRLGKGRDLLRSRLAKQGVAVMAVGGGLELGVSTAPASISEDLISTTARAAVGLFTGNASDLAAASPVAQTLVAGELKKMLLGKITVAAVVSLIATVAIASGFFVTNRPLTIAGLLSRGVTGGKITITEYVPGKDPIQLNATGSIVFANGLEIVTDTRNDRFIYRKGPNDPFKVSAIQACRHPKGIAYNDRDGLYYGLDIGGDRLVAFRDLTKNEIAGATAKIGGVQLINPHGIAIDPVEGWIYVINSETSVLVRCKGIGKSEGVLPLQHVSHYCRSVTYTQGKVFVSGSSGGKIIEIDDFAAGKYTVHKSFHKKREFKVGDWESDGLIPNTVEYYKGYWYVGSFFAAEFAKKGKDYNKNKFIRFKTWKDFETGNWEDLSGLLPDRVVPYVLTLRPEALYLAVFQPSYEPNKDKVYKITVDSP
jgi:RNA polymerase sigma factor (sigma-70 family)